MPEHDLAEGPLLGSTAADDESSIATHLRALGSVIRGAVQFGSNQVIIVAQMFAAVMSFRDFFRLFCLKRFAVEQCCIMFPQSEAEMLVICIIIYGALKFCEPAPVYCF